jgi:CHAT domain-containing protein/Tfp pilus assembly protein PilF/uncharacterized glyoxalase superfamily protein PhnB
MSFSKCSQSSLLLLPVAFLLSGYLFRGLTCVAPVSASPQANSTELATDSYSLPEVGKTISPELSPRHSHSYPIALEKDQYFHAVINQKEIDLGVTFYEPSGKPVTRFDCRYYGPTPVSLIAEVSGVYRLELMAPESEQAVAHYELRVEAIRPSIAEDHRRIAAEKTFAHAERLLTEWQAEASRKAIDEFNNSLSMWQALGERGEEIQTFKRIGDIYETFAEYDDALASYRKGLSLSQGANDRWHESEILNAIGWVYLSLGKHKEAMRLCNEAFGLSQEVGHRRAEAQALNNLGEIYNYSGDLQKAIEFYRRALPVAQAINDRRGQAQSHTYLGYTYSDLGQVNEALDTYNQALSFWKAARDRRGEGITLAAVGRLYSRMGESQKALSIFEEARQYLHRIGDPVWEASTLNGIAYVYDGLGEKERALEYYDQSLPLLRKAHYVGAEASTLGEAGRMFLSLGDKVKALQYHQQALAIFTKIGDRRMQMVELKEIGRVLDAQGDKAEALQNYLRARSFYHAEKDLRGEAVTLNLIGGIHEASGQTEKALAYYAQALPLTQRAEYPVGEAATLYNMARAERIRARLIDARARIDAALKVIESLRTRVASQDFRASYFASIHQYYELGVDVLMQLQKDQPTTAFAAMAFAASEKARARSLLESLKEARADIREGVDPTLLDRERQLERALNTKAEQRSQLITAGKVQEAQAVATEIDQLTTEYEDVRGQIRSQSPRYAALTQPQPLSLNEVQKQVLDDDTLLLEYMLGEERSYLWAITRSEVSSFELPGRAQIEDAARRFHALLTANQPVAGDTFDRRQARVAEANTHISEAAAAFSKLVLGPVVTKLGKKRLLIVPDGALQYIPFQALTVPATAKPDDATAQARINDRTDEPVPLIVDHEIVNEPSASALALVLSDTAQRKPAPNSIAVFANPVFEADDPRVNSTGAQAPISSQKAEVQEAFRDIGLGDGTRIPPLPASREEAEAIMAVVPWRSGLKALGFDASRATMTATNLSQYHIVHFATHGFVDYQHPELSGLVLSLVDQQGRPQDGFLRLHDIYNLKLPVDLVVLSACNTGLGKEVKGEGLIGLTRGFMYAGAGGVAASLWKVDDEATAELMKGFYAGMFQQRLTPAAALREAQVAMWRQKRWHAPYYWAAFVIQGQYDAKQYAGLKLAHTVEWGAAIGSLAVVLLLGTFFLLRRRRRRIL